MARRKPENVAYRRKRENKTNYGRRLRSLLSQKLRLVVRLTNTKLIAQLVQFSPQGDKVLFGVDSSYLQKLGWSYSLKSVPASYLVGLLFAKKACQKGYNDAIMETGFRVPTQKGRLYAFLKGVIDGGFVVPYGDVVFPPEEQLLGKNIQAYIQEVKGKSTLQFAQYLKSVPQAKQIEESVKQLKQKLME